MVLSNNYMTKCFEGGASLEEKHRDSRIKTMNKNINRIKREKRKVEEGNEKNEKKFNKDWKPLYQMRKQIEKVKHRLDAYNSQEEDIEKWDKKFSSYLRDQENEEKAYQTWKELRKDGLEIYKDMLSEVNQSEEVLDKEVAKFKKYSNQQLDKIIESYDESIKNLEKIEEGLILAINKGDVETINKVMDAFSQLVEKDSKRQEAIGDLDEELIKNQKNLIGELKAGHGASQRIYENAEKQMNEEIYNSQDFEEIQETREELKESYNSVGVLKIKNTFYKVKDKFKSLF